VSTPNALVDLIHRLDPVDVPTAMRANASAITIHLQGGAAAQLEMSFPNASQIADILDDLRANREPVYLEVDLSGNRIRRVLLPRVMLVARVDAAAVGGTHQVELEPSQAVYSLRTTNPDYQQLLTALQAAQAQKTPVLITDTLDDHEIVDVRPVPPSLAAKANQFTAPKGGPRPSGIPPPAGLAGISPADPQQAYKLVNGQTCYPSSPSSTCIPFLYPDDGCWARAHEMARLLLGAGFAPRKVWLYGTLRVDTPNNPNCQVRWRYHVTVTLLVNTGSALETWAIDPSMFPGPVRQDAWVSAQHDPAAVAVDTDATVYYRDPSGNITIDPEYEQTRIDLATYRRRLQLRSATSGPPPYAQCS
jgi:hypothetical protein